jgi:hydrogenase maturation protein HypF
MTVKSDAPQGKRITLQGRVQGLGVRPSLTRLARKLGLAGRIWNASNGVTVELFGLETSISQFEEQLSETLPNRVQVQQCLSHSIPFCDSSDFVIEREGVPVALTAEVPRDICICSECITEIDDPTNRRFRYWLNSCVDCGPRFSILSAMPYERATTSMDAFALCDLCASEYTSIEDRRFHAQGISCPQCGPKITVTDHEGIEVQGVDPIFFLAGQIKAGKIVAVKGIGGYQLLCDATNHPVVMRLRSLKARPLKPFALLVLDRNAALDLAELSGNESKVLSADSNPILLSCPRKGIPVAQSVIQDTHLIGMMLPTTGLHYGLAKHTALPLVCTSANLEGEPLLSETPVTGDPAWDLADYWLHHDRKIVVPIDDSVVRVIGDRPQTYRLARGLAPLPLPIKTKRSFIALGSDLKSSLATSHSGNAVLGPHIGDVANVKTRQRFNDQVVHFKTLYDHSKISYVSDLHPDFYGSAFVRQNGQRTHLVQHHLAHLFATLLDHPKFEGPFLGIAWDGYGFGANGESWGGEAFLVRDVQDVKRVATVRPFPLPGGDMAVRQPWRIATALLLEAFGPGEWTLQLQRVWPECAVLPLTRWMTQSHASIGKTSSLGRLFDAVSSLLLDATESEYEGHAAIRLEGIAYDFQESIAPFPIETTSGLIIELDWRPIVREIWKHRCEKAQPSLIARRFHETLGEYVAAIQKTMPDLPVVLSGGVFQNRILVETIKNRLHDACPVLSPAAIPANDGGLAAGQLSFVHELESLKQKGQFLAAGPLSCEE